MERREFIKTVAGDFGMGSARHAVLLPDLLAADFLLFPFTQGNITINDALVE